MEASQYETRIRQLERRSRWMMWTLWLLVGGILMGQTPRSKSTPPPPPAPEVSPTPDIVSTRRLRLLDDEGRPRANLFVQGDEVFVILGESNGKPRLALRARDGGDASIVLAGSDGEPRAALQCGSDGTVRRVP